MKKFLRSTYIYPALLILAFAVSSCGGGGGGSAATTDTTATTSKGKFVDAAVEGITYTSGSITGVTTADGSFSYETGQTVTFSIGGITLGTIGGSAIITPVQLIAGAVNQLNPFVTNIVQFLISIDDDNDVTNGIKITPAMSAAATGLSIDFTSATFDTDGSVANAVSAIKAVASIGSIGLVNDAVAQAHLRDSLFSIIAGTYSGTYTGVIDNGTWTVTIDASGTLIPPSTSTSAVDSSVLTVTGSVSTSGTVAASASGGAGSSSWVGTLNITTGGFSGTWTDTGDNGTFTGNKI